MLGEEDLPGYWLDLGDELARRPMMSLWRLGPGAPGFLPIQGLLCWGQSLQKPPPQREERRLLHHLPGPCLVHPLLHIFQNPIRCQGCFSRCQKGKEHSGPPRLSAATSMLTHLWPLFVEGLSALFPEGALSIRFSLFILIQILPLLISPAHLRPQRQDLPEAPA